MAERIKNMAERLAALVQDLASNPDYASGRRRYPRTVSADDAADIAEALHEQVDKGTTARAETAKRQLLVIACDRGCNTCCEEPIMVTLPEALSVARFLRRPDQAAVRAGFLERYPAWRATVGDNLTKLAEAGQRRDKEVALDLHRRSRALCPFNAGGDCSVYPVRPTVCRNAHALNTPALCGPHASGEKAEQLEFAPLDDFVVKGRNLLFAAHHALPRTGRMLLVALADAVHELVAAPMAEGS
jgi:hypothetical protein